MDLKLLVGLLPLLLGIANHFKIFAPSPDALEGSVNLKKLDLTEKLIKSHMRLFSHFRSLVKYDVDLGGGFTAAKALRGDGHGEEDFFSAYANDLFRYSKIISRLDEIHAWSRALYNVQFYLTLLGFFLLFLIFVPLFTIYSQYFFWVFSAIFICQCVCLMGLRSCKRKVQYYEETA